MPSVSRKSAVPPPLAFIPPLAPTLVDEPPAGDNWLHEIKHDGFRTLLLVDRGTPPPSPAAVMTGRSAIARIVEAAAALPCQAAIIDGEAVVQDASGRSDLAFLHEAMDREPHRLVFFAFDLLHLDGDDLRRQPLEERRARLRELIAPDPHSAIQFSEAICGRWSIASLPRRSAWGWKALSRSVLAAAIKAAPHAIG